MIDVNKQSDKMDNQDINIEEPYVLNYDNRVDAGRGFVISLVALILLPNLGVFVLNMDYGFPVLISLVIAAYGIKVSKRGLTSSAKRNALTGIIIGVVVEIISCCMMLNVCILKILDFIIQ